MAKKQYIMIIDTETTLDDLVADFAAVIVDKKGRVFSQCAVLVRDVYNDRNGHCLFYDQSAGHFSRARLAERYAKYDTMLDEGTRMLASVAAINRWLERAAAKYMPFLTAYNLNFDRVKCQNTGIDLTMFPNQFCLWAAAANKWAFSKKYRQFILDNHAFNNPTGLGNMTYKANAETMARFVLQNSNLADEPHTALEDIIYYELPIFRALAANTKLTELQALSPPPWQKMQVKDHFKPV